MADLLERILAYAGPKGDLVLRGEVPTGTNRFHIISVDDHLIETPDLFRDRVPARMRDAAPHLERDAAGNDWWVFENDRVPLLGSDALRGWEAGKGYLGPVNFDELHPATYDAGERVRHMDAAGIAAQLNFPSAPFGFAGRRFLTMGDHDLGLASLRAYNDWLLDAWITPYPERFIACQLPWLGDPELAAAEVRRNAERGFVAVTFSENPERLGLPSLYSDAWDPFFRACEETGTVVNLHVGSSSETIVPSRDSTAAVLGVLFPINSMAAAADWLFARIPVRFPDIKIALSEGGIGWVPMFIDRIEFMGRDLDYRADFGSHSPVDYLRRNFWFTVLSDPATMRLRHLIGVDHIMVETDYPHPDSTWPDSQEVLARQFAGVPDEEVERMTHRNAAALYRHTVATP
ncbi:amidohydrolase family protein [Embleya sp. NPDC001921]